MLTFRCVSYFVHENMCQVGCSIRKTALKCDISFGGLTIRYVREGKGNGKNVIPQSKTTIQKSVLVVKYEYFISFIAFRCLTPLSFSAHFQYGNDICNTAFSISCVYVRLSSFNQMTNRIQMHMEHTKSQKATLYILSI